MRVKHTRAVGAGVAVCAAKPGSVLPVVTALLLFIAILICFAPPSHAAPVITPMPSPAAQDSAANASYTQSVPQTTQTPRPRPTPWNQLGVSATTPKPSPTGDPMIQQFIREDVEKVFTSDVVPTPPNATKDKGLSVKQAADNAISAAQVNFRSLDITRQNIQKQIDTLRQSVNMAISALEFDDRYRELVEADELWGDKLEEDIRFEFEMYEAMDYKELTYDERRELISIRDMGYERFNMNITRVDHNIEIMRWQLTYAAYAQYAGMAKMQAAIALQQEALDLQYKNLEILRKKYELGAATRIETENAGISYDKAVIELNKQKRSLTSLTAGFNRLVGENLATTYQDFDRTKLAPTKRDDSVESYIAAALENRSELLLAKQEMSLAQRQAQLYESEISKFSTLDDKQDALQDAEEAAIDYELAVQDVESEINNAYKQLVALRGMNGYYESQIQTAQENYERTQKLFELGMTTAISVDQVRMSVTQAKMQLENNQIDIWQQQQKLKIISGIGPGGL